jgi:sialic acid synthase SpsE
MKSAKDAGLDAVKIQLFPEGKNGNIVTPVEWWDDLAEEAKTLKIDFSASCFNDHLKAFVLSKRPPFLKIAHSMRGNFDWMEECKSAGVRCIVTTNFLDIQSIPDKVETLYTFEINKVPVYPVTSIIDFEGIFSVFTGFSDHSINSVNAWSAKEHGAKVIECHIKPTEDAKGCPDAGFAMGPKKLLGYTRGLR